MASGSDYLHDRSDESDDSSDDESFRTESFERKKFEKARKLHGFIDRILQDCENKFDLIDCGIKYYNNIIDIHIAVIIYLLNLTAYRPGTNYNKKKNGQPTGVGISTMRSNNLELLENNTIYINLYGKRHIVFDKKFQVDKRVYSCLQKCLNDKGDEQPLFQVSNNHVKGYLKENYDPDITPRVFRTYNASKLFQKKLNELTERCIKESHNEDPETRIRLLTSQYETTLNEVRTLLNHTSQNAYKSYVDPRIIVAWANKYRVPLNKLNGFRITADKKETKLREARKWAIDELNGGSDYDFENINMDNSVPMQPYLCICPPKLN